MDSGYTKAGSGKSMARHLARVIVVSTMAGFLIWCWRQSTLPATWGAIFVSICGLVGTPWAISHAKHDSSKATNEEVKKDEGGE